MANYKQDLSEVGKKISALKSGSDAEMLQGLVGVGLNIVQNLYLDKQKETRSQLTRSISSLEDSLKAIDYTQSETEIEIDGETINLYDRQVELANQSLKNFQDMVDDPAFRLYRDDLALINEHAVTKLAYQDSMKDLREDNLDNLEDLASEYKDLVRKDPSFTDEGTWSEAKDIINDIEKAYAETEYQFGKKIPIENALEIQQVLQQYELDQRNVIADANRTIPGFQIEFAEKASPYLEQFFKDQGMIDISDPGGTYDPETETTVYGDEWYASWVKDEQIETPAGQKTFMPKKARVPAPGGGTLPEYVGEAFPPVTAYELPDPDMYKPAISAFNKWEQISLGVKATELGLKGEAPDYEIFDKVEQYVADPTKANIAMLIGHGVWGDTENEPLEDLIAFKKLSKKDQKIVTDSINDLDAREATGKFRTESNALQNKINTILPGIMRKSGKLSGIVDVELANQIEFRGITLNEGIDLWNSKYKASQEMDLPNITVLKKDEATLASVTDSKISHVELLENIIKKEIEDEGWFGDTALSADPTGNLKALLGNPNAPIETKWALIHNLTTEFLGPKGDTKRPGDVDDMFDGDADRINLFYNVLKSFQKLMEAEPLGEAALINQIGLDLTGPEGTLSKAMRYAFPGTLPATE